VARDVYTFVQIHGCPFDRRQANLRNRPRRDSLSLPLIKIKRQKSRLGDNAKQKVLHRRQQNIHSIALSASYVKEIPKLRESLHQLCGAKTVVCWEWCWERKKAATDIFL
jgi:hypothetical protein